MKWIRSCVVLISVSALHASTTQERLGDTVTKGDVPQVSYFLKRFDKEQRPSSEKIRTLTQLSTVAQNLLTRDKKSTYHVSMTKVAAGAALAFMSGFFAKAWGLDPIYEYWSKGYSQRMEHYYYLMTLGIPALFGSYLAYDGVLCRSEKEKIADARDIRDLLDDKVKELRS